MNITLAKPSDINVDEIPDPIDLVPDGVFEVVDQLVRGQMQYWRKPADTIVVTYDEIVSRLIVTGKWRTWWSFRLPHMEGLEQAYRKVGWMAEIYRGEYYDEAALRLNKPTVAHDED